MLKWNIYSGSVPLFQNGNFGPQSVVGGRKNKKNCILLHLDHVHVNTEEEEEELAMIWWWLSFWTDDVSPGGGCGCCATPLGHRVPFRKWFNFRFCGASDLRIVVPPKSQAVGAKKFRGSETGTIATKTTPLTAHSLFRKNRRWIEWSGSGCVSCDLKVLVANLREITQKSIRC